ncbi:MAG: hypothetical protein AAGC80_21780 [Rhodococcus sp. (in: high G+C Gram-positive bacteria)]
MNYDEVDDWSGQPWSQDVTGVAVDSHDRVYLLQRGPVAVTVLDPDGAVVDRWRNEWFSDRPHLISIGRDDLVRIADDGGHKVFTFDLDGRLLGSIGDGAPSRTGFDQSTHPRLEDALSQMGGGLPFNRPTKFVSSPWGDLYVSDGYRNCRVHRFSADGQLLSSWGGPGAEPGRFVIPHSLTTDHDGRILVCDRENDRIQVFTADGELLDVWDNVQRPTDVAVDPRGFLYVTELPRGPLDLESWRLGRAATTLPGRVSVWSPEGALVGRIEPPECEFAAPHAIAVDSSGAVYVSEVPESFATSTGRAQRAHRCLRKFQPRHTPTKPTGATARHHEYLPDAVGAQPRRET